MWVSLSSVSHEILAKFMSYDVVRFFWFFAKGTDFFKSIFSAVQMFSQMPQVHLDFIVTNDQKTQWWHSAKSCNILAHIKVLESYGRHKFKSFDIFLKIVISELEDWLDHIFPIAYSPLDLRIYKYILNLSKDYFLFLAAKMLK